jgi:hypothetical protein
MRMRMGVVGVAFVLLVVSASCGARTQLAGSVGEPDDAGVDAKLDSPLHDAPWDAPEPVDAPPPPPPPPPPADAALCCEDGQNTNYPPDALSAGASVAWQYIPACNIVVKGIELHNRGGLVVLRDSNGAQPGAALFKGTLPVPAGPGLDWVGTDVQPPVPLTAGHVYWIQEAPGPLSEASDGVQYTYWADNGGGSWSGPFNWHPYTSRIHGVCD